MAGPRLRTVNKAVAPYSLGAFPKSFYEKFAEEIVYRLATKDTMKLEGDEWKEVFAKCIGADWKPSNVGLDDVVLNNCCWSAKTVFGNKKLEKQKKVRLISGRNSPVYSFGEEKITPSADPNYIGKLVLDIWNERVSGIRQIFKFARTVVLVKSKNFSDFLLFETDTVRYDPELYYFVWNKKGNLEGFDKTTNEHKFTWQPSGSQFTIIEDIPEGRVHLKVKRPEKMNKQEVLDTVGFTPAWVQVLED